MKFQSPRLYRPLPIAVAWVLAAFYVCLPARAAEPSLRLWYDKPAADWEREALPIGNGYLGAMCFGAMHKERIQFNEHSLWIGDETATGAYQAFGDLFIEMAHPDGSDYRRELDIGRGVHTVSYRSGGIQYRREYFASYPARVIALRFTADQPGAYAGTVALTDTHKAKIMAAGDRITSSGSLAGYAFMRRGKPMAPKGGYAIALQYEAEVAVLHDGGTLTIADNKIAFRNVNSLTILLAAGTDFVQDRSKGWRGEPPHRAVAASLAAAVQTPYQKLLADHVEDFRALTGRVTLDLGSTESAPAALPTDRRLAAYKLSPKDPELEALLFQYGRYLMVSSSRPGALPANLQGKWNQDNNPAWHCDYHTDLNIEMNYGMTDVANLSECFQPYAAWIQSIRAVRVEATKKAFAARGWTIRGSSGPFGGSDWEWMPGCNAWLLQNSYDHYRFTMNKQYLRNFAYPAMKEVCEFWIDCLKKLPDGKLVTPKGFSPEHGPKEDGVSFDMQMAWDVFNNTIEASEALGLDKDFRELLVKKRDGLAKPKIGHWGQLQEWLVDRDKPREHYVVTAHLVAVFPGRQISVEKTPELAKAAAVSLDARGVVACEWAYAWRMSLWARLEQGDKAHVMAENLIQRSLLPNLFGTMPPMQIDSDFGYVSGVCELLLQSQADEIRLLPALPKAWPAGKVTGLRARGGFSVDIAWKDGTVTGYRIASAAPQEVRVRVNGKSTTIQSQPW